MLLVKQESVQPAGRDSSVVDWQSVHPAGETVVLQEAGSRHILLVETRFTEAGGQYILLVKTVLSWTGSQYMPLVKKKLVNWLLMGVLGDAHMYLKSKSKESVRWMAGSDLLRLIFGMDMYSDSREAST